MQKRADRKRFLLSLVVLGLLAATRHGGSSNSEPAATLNSAAVPEISFREVLYGRGLGFVLPESICGGVCANDTYQSARAATVRLYPSGCLGIAVSDSWVLTAAHCLERPPELVIFGDAAGNGVPRKVDSSKVTCEHKDHRFHPIRGETSDLALVPFAGGAPGTYPFQPTSSPNDQDPVIALAWGTVQLPERDEDCFVRTVNMKAFSNSACQAEHDREMQPKRIDSVEFCAGDVNSSIFLGASGSPVFRDLGAGGTGELVGIVSDVRGTGGCRDRWDIHTKLDVPWIEDVLAGRTAGNCK